MLLINLWEVEYWEIEVITFIVECSIGRKQMHYIRAALSTMNSQALVAPNYHPPFQLSILMFIFNKITLLFHLFFPLFVVFVSIYPYNLMVRTAFICWPYIIPQLRTFIEQKVKKGLTISPLSTILICSDSVVFLFSILS